MKSTVFWNITPCNPLSTNRRLGGTYRLHLQGQRISRARNQRESRWQKIVQFTNKFCRMLCRKCYKEYILHLTNQTRARLQRCPQMILPYASFMILVYLIRLVVHLLNIWNYSLSKGCHLDVVGGPSSHHDPESDAGGSLSSWQGHPSR
jgi:hypothetical protein